MQDADDNESGEGGALIERDRIHGCNGRAKEKISNQRLGNVEMGGPDPPCHLHQPTTPDQPGGF